MIVTVTLNPGLDLTYTVDVLRRHAANRVRSVTERAGGKGLNVAHVLHAAGEPVLATGLLGGATGERIRSLVAAAGLESSFVDIEGSSRRTVSVVDGGDATGLLEPGPTVTAGEWGAFVARFAGLLAGAAVVVVSGSLPPGVPVDAYATLVRMARDAGVPTVLDTSGPPLRYGLAAGPDVAKPNGEELAAVLPGGAQAEPGCGGAEHPQRLPGGAQAEPGCGGAEHPQRLPGGAQPSPTRSGTGGDLELAARALALGPGAVVVSHGPRGLLGLTRDAGWWAAPPQPVAGNPTGAGDACVAALARGVRDGTPWPALLADAVALSAAAVAAPVAGAYCAETYRRIAPGVTVSPVSLPARRSPC